MVVTTGAMVLRTMTTWRPFERVERRTSLVAVGLATEAVTSREKIEMKNRVELVLLGGVINLKLRQP